MFSFMDLCGKPVAAADYIALCDHFHTLVLKGVPIFRGSNRQEGYRSAAPIFSPLQADFLTCASMRSSKGCAQSLVSVDSRRLHTQHAAHENACADCHSHAAGF